MAGDLFADFDAGVERSQYGTVPARPVELCDPTVAAAERPRLTRQCQEILDRLRRGRVGNDVLAGISRKYTGRISDLRKSGYDPRCVERDHRTGHSVYALFENGVEVAG